MVVGNNVSINGNLTVENNILGKSLNIESIIGNVINTQDIAVSGNATINHGLNVGNWLTISNEVMYFNSGSLVLPFTDDNNDIIHKERGVIAQHLLNTDISYIVYGGGKDELDNDIPYGVRYNDLLVTSCQAIKEQQQIILDLSNQNLNLKNEINSNLLRIQQIESENIIIKNTINKLLRDNGRTTI